MGSAGTPKNKIATTWRTLRKKGSRLWREPTFFISLFGMTNPRPHTVRRWFAYSACQSEALGKAETHARHSLAKRSACQRELESAKRSACACGSRLKGVRNCEKLKLWLFVCDCSTKYALCNKKAYKRNFELLRL